MYVVKSSGAYDWGGVDLGKIRSCLRIRLAFRYIFERERLINVCTHLNIQIRRIALEKCGKFQTLLC